MSIRSKILIPMVITSILATSTILFFNVMQFSAFVDNYIEDELERAILKVADEIEGLKLKSQTAIMYYANDNELINALEHSDQKTLAKRATELMQQTNVESLSVVDTNAIVLARGHNPGYYGDDASNLPIVQAAFNGNYSHGASLGVTTSISVRASAPVYNSEGRLIGALFAGDRLDTEKFVDRIKTFTGCEITVFIDDVRVATTLHDEHGVRATGSVDPGYMEKAILSVDEVIRQVDFQGHEIMEKHTPVYSIEGDIIGIISAGTYLNEKQGMMKSFITTGFLITIIFILSSIMIIFFVSRQIAAPIDHSIDQARYDSLTGVFNRRAFEEQLSLLLKTLSRSGGTVSLMMIDIDFFKNYNDTYGHIKGDECLKTVASILTQTISRADDFVARYGGEEFVAVLPNTDGEGACLMAERLLEGIRKCNIPHGESDISKYVTISIGVTTGKADKTLSNTDFIRQADIMLYESKRNGRNMYTFKPMK